MRYLKDPSKDGISVNDIGQYCPGMDVHHSSGIYNRAFYLLSHSPGWTVRMAFQTFATANQLYWTPDSTFSQVKYANEGFFIRNDLGPKEFN